MQSEQDRVVEHWKQVYSNYFKQNPEALEYLKKLQQHEGEPSSMDAAEFQQMVRQVVRQAVISHKPVDVSQLPLPDKLHGITKNEFIALVQHSANAAFAELEAMQPKTEEEYRPRLSEFKTPIDAFDAVWKNEQMMAEEKRQRTLEQSAAIIETKRVGHFHTTDFPIMPLPELKEKVSKMSLLRVKGEAEWINDLVARLEHFPERLRKEVEDSVIGRSAPDRPDLIEQRWAAQQDTLELIASSITLWKEVAKIYEVRIQALEQQGTPAHITELIKIGSEAAKRAHKIMQAMRKVSHDMKPKMLPSLQI